MAVTIEAPLTYDAAGERIPTPMVEAVVAGVPTRLIVDTGATGHVLTVELVERAGLSYEPGEPGTDVAGSSVPSWDVGDVAASISGTSLVLHDVVAIAGPPPFERWGIGGFVSPQRLYPTGVVVLDLAAGLLQVHHADPAGERDASTRPGFASVDVHRHRGVLAVTAAVAPFDECIVFFDSGSGQTELARAAVPGLASAASRNPSFGVGGAAIDEEVIAEVVLTVGDLRFPLPELHVRDHIPPVEGISGVGTPQGLLGMDVMQGTVIVIGADGGPVRWLVPS